MFVDVFGTLGKKDGVPEGSQTELEKFVCCVYGKPSYKDVSENALDTDSDDDENIRVASLLDIMYDDRDDDFETQLH